MYYKLDKENNPVLCKDFNEFIEWETSNPDKKRVNINHIQKVMISTVYLGLDHAFRSKGPILWETMIFGGKHDQYQVRYSSYEDAVKGHKIAVDLVYQEKYGKLYTIYKTVKTKISKIFKVSCLFGFILSLFLVLNIHKSKCLKIDKTVYKHKTFSINKLN